MTQPVQTLVKVLPAVITSLEREASERGEALAVGLCRVVKKYRFIFTLYAMCDVLPLISYLSRLFQFSELDLSTLDKMVSSTIENLKLLCDQPGEFSGKLDSGLVSVLTPFNIHHNSALKQQCQKNFFLEVCTEADPRYQG